MRRLLRALLLMVGLLVVVVAGLHLWAQFRLDRAPTVQAQAVSVPTDDGSVARGSHLALISACVGCHGENLGGDDFINEAPIGYLPAPNLTSGAGGIGDEYTDADWERAIRHGVAKDGRTLGAMPSHFYSRYGDEDLGALIAYLKRLPPVDNELGARAIAFPGTILFGVMGARALPVNRIDHAAVGGAAPSEEVSVQYGEYLTYIAGCRSCHGIGLNGDVDPGEPAGPSLTTESEMGTWTEEQFLTALRTGIHPSGRMLDPEMPWMLYAEMNDTEARAIYAYLQTVGPTEAQAQ